jgi:hypothetical protein
VHYLLELHILSQEVHLVFELQDLGLVVVLESLQLFRITGGPWRGGYTELGFLAAIHYI